MSTEHHHGRGGGGGGHGSSRLKQNQSCDRCREKRKRCSGYHEGGPPCDYCRRHFHECTNSTGGTRRLGRPRNPHAQFTRRWPAGFFAPAAPPPPAAAYTPDSPHIPLQPSPGHFWDDYNHRWAIDPHHPHWQQFFHPQQPQSPHVVSAPHPHEHRGRQGYDPVHERTPPGVTYGYDPLPSQGQEEPYDPVRHRTQSPHGGASGGYYFSLGTAAHRFFPRGREGPERASVFA
ncbi:hypothetical protein JCM6882_008728 [Rhodosporidiobolus microsporus]